MTMPWSEEPAGGAPRGSKVLDMARVLNHPQSQYQGPVWQQGGYRSAGAPVKLSRTPEKLRRQPPKLED